MTSFVSVSLCVIDMSVCVDAVLVCHVINNVAAADNVAAYFAYVIALKTLLHQLGTSSVRNCVHLATSSMRHRAAV